VTGRADTAGIVMGACQAPTFGKRARYAIMAGNHDVCAAQDALPLYLSICRDRRGQDGASTAAPVYAQLRILFLSIYLSAVTAVARTGHRLRPQFPWGRGGPRGEGVRDA
jgi:hypothetical protein